MAIRIFVRYRNGHAQHGRSRRRTLGTALLLCHCAAALAQPAAQTDPEADVNPREPTASRAMLEFLTEFGELDDTEFELLTAYAERDAAEEPQDSEND